MSFITLAVLCLIGEPRAGGFVRPNSISWEKIPYYLVWGKAQPQYWYIPFVSVLFIFSPFLTRLSTKTLVWFTIVSFACVIVFPSRAGSKLTPSLTIMMCKYTFFSFYYIVGFLYARMKKEIDPYLKAYMIPALILAIMIGIGLLEPSLFRSAILRGDFACSFQKFLLIVPVLVVAIALKNKKK